jgi:acetamidase/formamidase
MTAKRAVKKRGGQTHYVSWEDFHASKFDNSLKPVLTIEPGDTVVFNCLDSGGGQVTPGTTVDKLATIDWDVVHPLTGPIAMAGAQPGDVLKVEVLEFEHYGYGFTIISSDGGGLLPEFFNEPPDLHIWKIGEDRRAEFRNGIRLPIEPFMGVMGNAPKEPGAHSTLPPTHLGWNLDSRHTCKGATIYFPIEVPGALFSTGDCHLAQGDGEICVTAIEAPVVVTLRFDLIRGQNLSNVYFTTEGPTTSKYDGMGHYVTVGTGPDLHTNVQNAARRMIELLGKEHGMSATDAYMLISVAADLKIAVPVLDTKGHAACVTLHMPRSIF